ncbi:hypothetical protein D1007_40311 [Hordeum vulgare]|nr:hypothetical protein D1007_40311 [Hordeum vulgare]
MQLRSIDPSQGCPGAYSEAAAKKAYPSCETVPCEFGLEAGRVHAMALETKQVGPCIKKVLRSAPGFFAFLLSSSPVIICTTLLLGILLSYGDTDLPEANDEDTKTTPEILSLKMQNPNCKVMVDNCYGEFVETSEPPMVGADLIARSLIKTLVVPSRLVVATLLGRKIWLPQLELAYRHQALGWSLG